MSELNNVENDMMKTFSRPTCAYQSDNEDAFLSYQIPVSIASQQLMYSSPGQSVYNIMYSQSVYRSPSNYQPSNPLDMPMTWSQDSSKEFSSTQTPPNYFQKSDCAESFKSTDAKYQYDGLNAQWMFNSNYSQPKYTELPSCSELNSPPILYPQNMNSFCPAIECSADKGKYFLPQKSNSLFPYNLDQNYSCESPKSFPSCSLEGQENTGLMDGKASSALEPQSKPLQKAGEEENDSDIIIEDSDDAASDTTDIITAGICCTVCRTKSDHLQYYFVDSSSPISATSKIPILKMLNSILNLPKVPCPKKVCSVCIALINSIDHFEKKLTLARNELVQKYETATKLLRPEKVPAAKTRKHFAYRWATHGVVDCSMCRRKFPLDQYVKYHKSRHQEVYLKRFARKRRPKRDQATQTDKERSAEEPCISSCCGKQFACRKYVAKHELVCRGLVSYSCKLCSQVCKTDMKLRKHLKIVHQRGTSIKCSECGARFAKPSDFKAHQLSHSLEKNYACQVCGKRYKSLGNLTFHAKSHDRAKLHQCSFCGKEFPRKDTLDSHLNVHRNVAPFTCPICGKRFASSKYLEAHKKVHSKANFLQCEICSKLVIKHGMEDHLRSHANLKEFECDRCQLKFNTKGALLKHVKRKHET